MVFLLLNGLAIDPVREWEIFSDTGFTVDVIYNQKRPESGPRRVVNVTEFHWLYDLHENSVALESDIDCAGLTLDIDRLLVVSISGKVNLSSSLNNLVESWHKGNGELPLHDFLGVSFAQYGKWIEKPEIASVE